MMALGWALLALLGQAAMLLLTHAGRGVGYQHFVPLSGQGSLQHAAQAVLAAQAIIVTAVFVARRAGVAALLARLLPGRWLPVAFTAMVLTGATVSRDLSAYGLELALAGFAQLVQLATVAFAAAALTPERVAAFRRLTDKVLGSPANIEQPGTFDRFIIIAALWTAAVAYLLAVVAYERHPHVPDEIVYLLHARYFAKGLLAMPIPAVPEAFNLDLMTYQATRWFSPVPPGWPAMLAVGAWLGTPWLVDPVLGGLNVLLTYAVLRELYSRRTARIVVLLLCASPWALFMAMNVMTHTFTLTCALLAALSVGRMRRGKTIAWAVLGGAALGVISLIRPLEAAACAALLGLWSLGAKWRTIPLIPSALLTASAVAVGALNLPYNRALTGNARVFPIMAYTDRIFGPGTNALGFGANRGLGWSGLDPYPGHGLRDVLVNTNLNLFQVNIELLGWSCGALLAVWLLLASGRLRRPDWMMIAVVATIIGLHAFYWFSGGPDFGARYWFLILVPTLVLVARGIEETDETLTHTLTGVGALEPAALLMLLALVTFMPWRATDKYYHYRGMRPDIREIGGRLPTGPSLVLVRGNRHPDYHSAAAYNPVDLFAGVPVYAWDRGPAVRARLMEVYSDRPIWIVDGPSLTHAGFRVIAGPLTADQVRALP